LVSIKIKYIVNFNFFAVLGFELRAYTLATPPALFCDEFFEIGSNKLFCLGWLQTVTLLISAS
jgi:hypothetical protein